MKSDLAFLSIAAAGRLIAARKLSPVELVEAHLERIAAYDEKIKSYILVDAEGARAKAKQAEAEIMRGEYRGPLHGVPYGAKDNYFTRGLRTCANSRVLLDHVPDFDAAAIEKLNKAGAILLGKLNTWEFGTGHGLIYHDSAFAQARNPWRDNHFTGGSSTGSGASVAAGLAMFSLGADTGGSIRMPAAGCGLHGLKPTPGLVSRYGILPNSWSLDVAGPMARTAEDCGLVFDAISGHDPRDLGSVEAPPRGSDADVRGLKIGFVRDFGEPVQLDPAVAAGIEDVAAVLKEAGATFVDVALPTPPSTYRQVTALISGSERACVHEKEFIEKGDLMGRELREALMTGMAARAVDYVAAQRRRRELMESMDAVLAGVDVLLTPCAYLTAPSFESEEAVRAYMSQTCTTAFSVTGHPAHALPTGFDARGMPTGAQIVGRYFDDALLLRVAGAYDAARPWHEKHPEL